MAHTGGRLLPIGRRGLIAGAVIASVAKADAASGGADPHVSPEQLKAMQEKLQSGGLPGGALPNLPKDLPAGLRQGLPNLPGLTGLSNKPTLPGLVGPPGKKK